MKNFADELKNITNQNQEPERTEFECDLNIDIFVNNFMQDCKRQAARGRNTNRMEYCTYTLDFTYDWRGVAFLTRSDFKKINGHYSLRSYSSFEESLLNPIQDYIRKKLTNQGLSNIKFTTETDTLLASSLKHRFGKRDYLNVKVKKLFVSVAW